MKTKELAPTDLKNEYVQTQLTYDHIDYPHSNNNLAVIKKQHAFIINNIKEYSTQRNVYMLDIGCGWGDFARKLDPYLTDYVGVEPSLVELKQFVKKDKIHPVRGFGETLDFLNDNSRNVILLNSVLDHCFDWKKTMQNCYRILAPGGMLIISMENASTIPMKFYKAVGIKHEHEGHVSHFSFEDLEAAITENHVIKQKNSFGYLYGFHYLTKAIKLPVGFLAGLNGLIDATIGKLFSHSGQILFFAAITKKTENGIDNCKEPFVCTNCKSTVAFKEKKCHQCGEDIVYVDDFILNTIIE